MSDNADFTFDSLGLEINLANVCFLIVKVGIHIIFSFDLVL